jgi:hypothetical protein
VSKLSEHQMAVLKRFLRGDEIWTLSGVNASCFWKNSSGRSPGTATVEALRCRGLIKDYERDHTGRKYRITDAGRQLVSSKLRGGK